MAIQYTRKGKTQSTEAELGEKTFSKSMMFEFYITTSSADMYVLVEFVLRVNHGQDRRLVELWAFIEF